MAKRYRISFEITLNDNAGHPRKWVPDAVCQGLEEGEDIYSWGFEELPEQDEDTPC